ncbi:MAG: hypothetical protein Q7T80_07430 [Methanoregula sp.]|nr:hypothetical protein [Methanoregula sp.]
MNRHIIIGIVILCILVSLFAIVTIATKQNGSPEMTDNKSFPIPEERIIASFGLGPENPGRTVFQDNPALIDTFLNVSEADINPYYYPKGPVIGYGKDMKGSIVVMIDESQVANQTAIKEIYDRFSTRGKTFHINSVPCKFISMGIVKIDIAKDTMP